MHASLPTAFVHLVVALLSIVATAGAAPVTQSDPLVKKAVDRIAEVEAAEAKLANGDRAGADAQLKRLAWATKRLGAVVQQGTAEWKAAKVRHDALRAKLEKKKAAPAPTPKPAPQPSGSGGSGKTPPPSPQPTPSPAPKPTPKVGTVDFEKLSRLNESISRSFNNLQLLSFKHFLDENRVQGLRREIEGFEVELAKFPAADANVKIVAGNLENHRKLFQLGVDRIDADRRTAPAITERLDGLFDQYDTTNFPLHVEPPYHEVQLRAWARELHRRRDVAIPADLEWLATVAGNVVVGSNRFLSVESHLTGSIARRLDEAEMYVKDALDGFAESGVEHARWLLETDPKDRNAILSRVLGEGAFDRNMVRLRESLHRVKMAAILDEELKRTAAPNRSAQAEAIQLGISHLEQLAKVSLADVRMPEAQSEDEALLRVAAETLQKEKYEIAGWQRLVINADARDHQRREAWLDPGTVRSTITFYDYRWKQFQVTTAEKVGDEVWLFANTLKRYESGDRTTPVGEWILSRRFKLTPILPENVAK